MLAFAAGLGCRMSSVASPHDPAPAAPESSAAASPSAPALPEASSSPSAAQSGAQSGAPPEASATGALQRLSVFFSGHSLLDNPLPDWVELIAQSRGKSMGWQQQIVLGSPIRVRTKGDDPDSASWPGYELGKSKSGGRIDVLRELRQPTELRAGETYERLLITERSDLLGAIRWEDTPGYLRHYHDRLVENAGSNAASLLYQCWPAIDRQAARVWIEYVRQELFGWECVAAKVNQTLRAEGRQDRVTVIPGGVALAALVERALEGNVPGISGSPRERLDAIFSDDAHLTSLGVYLLAAVHYAALFGESPGGAAGPAEVPRAALSALQEIAWEVVSSHRASALAPSLAECRERFAKQLCPAYQRFRGREDEVRGCGSWASEDSPLR